MHAVGYHATTQKVRETEDSTNRFKKMQNLRRDGMKIFRAGVDAVRGDHLVRACVRLDHQHLWLGEIGVARRSFDRLVVVGAGKASGAMAVGLVQALTHPESSASTAPTPVEIIGQINVPNGSESIPDGLRWPGKLTLFPSRPVAVNEPTAESIAGTDRILGLVRAAGARDLVVVLISGGGSALLCRPVAGITLDEKLAVIRHLSSKGADITELNTVRKHLSEVKGGGLARAVGDAAMVSLVLSDVLGDPLDLIASGPTMPDRSAPADALQVLAAFDPDRRLPAAIYRAISEPHPRSISTADDREFPAMVLGNNAVAVDAAGVMAESCRYDPVTHSAQSCEGDAETIGERLAEKTLTILRADGPLHRQRALITGGEPVVRLAESSVRGRGGRNQQLVLAAYRWLCNAGLSDDEWQRFLILSGGTDGEDGPTDAAGAFIDRDVHERAIERGLSPGEYLERNNAYEFFERTGGLMITGPTGTNVCDLRVALVD